MLELSAVPGRHRAVPRVTGKSASWRAVGTPAMAGCGLQRAFFSWVCANCPAEMAGLWADCRFAIDTFGKSQSSNDQHRKNSLLRRSKRRFRRFLRERQYSAQSPNFAPYPNMIDWCKTAVLETSRSCPTICSQKPIVFFPEFFSVLANNHSTFQTG